MSITAEIRAGIEPEDALEAIAIDDIPESVVSRPKQFPFLSAIDPYADTFLTKLQTQFLVDELRSALDNVDNPDDRDVLQAIYGIARKLLQYPPHHYLVFVGD
jgi:hypothetical protein